MNIFPTVRTRQPAQPVGIDLSNPLTRGLEWLWTPIASSGQVFSGATNVSGGVFGLGQRFRSSTTDRVTGTAVTSTPTANGTVFALMVSGPGTGAGGIVVRGGASSLGMRTGASTLYAIASGAALGPPLTIAKNTPVFVAVRNTGSAVSLFLNERKTSGTLSISAPVGPPLIGYTNSAQDCDHQIFAAGSFNRPLSDDEIASIRANPWQLFLPNPFLPGISTGGSVLDYSLSAGGSFSLSGIATFIRQKVLTAAGSLALSGTALFRKERTLSASGSVVFSGTAPFSSSAEASLSAGGTVDFSGQAALVKTKVLNSSGSVTFGGSAPLLFIPAGGAVATEAPRNISMSIGNKTRIS